MGELTGKVAIVTGASKGIGAAIARAFAEAGAAVAVNYASSKADADRVVGEIVKAGGRASPNYDSVADYLKAGLMIKQCVDEFGQVDIRLKSKESRREEKPEDRWTLFELHTRSDLRHVANRQRISPMQAMYRTEGPELK